MIISLFTYISLTPIYQPHEPSVRILQPMNPKIALFPGQFYNYLLENCCSNSHEFLLPDWNPITLSFLEPSSFHRPQLSSGALYKENEL